MDKTHPYAMAAASPMTGDVMWAVVATAIAAGRLRYGAPLLARAFRLKTPPSVSLPPVAISMPIVGNALWAGMLLWLGSAQWQPRTSRFTPLLRLGSLQAATTPVMLAQYLQLSMLTNVDRHRLLQHVPAVDLWGNWSYVMGHAIEGASFQYQATPQWIVIGTLLIGLIALPFGFFALRLSCERNNERTHQPDLATGDPTPVSPPFPHTQGTDREE